ASLGDSKNAPLLLQKIVIGFRLNALQYHQRLISLDKVVVPNEQRANNSTFQMLDRAPAAVRTDDPWRNRAACKRDDCRPDAETHDKHRNDQQTDPDRGT